MREYGDHDQLLVGSLMDGLPSLVAAAHELKSPLALIRQLSLILENDNINDEEKVDYIAK